MTGPRRARKTTSKAARPTPGPAARRKAPATSTTAATPSRANRRPMGTTASSPDEYIAAITGWRRTLAQSLRTHVRKTADLEEVIKWGHIVYFHNGPLLLIRAEEHRVLFAFWRGKRLTHIEPRLKPGGKYELATIDLREGDAVAPATIARLVTEAVRLNTSVGNPTAAPRAAPRPPTRPAATTTALPRRRTIR